MKDESHYLHQTPERCERVSIRHRCTGYDALLAAGVDRLLARERIGGRVQAILADWRR